MKNEAAEKLLKSLIEIESLSGDEQKVLGFVEELLTQEGFVIERIPVGKDVSSGQGTYCLLALVGQPLVILQAHLDTVTPYLPFAETDELILGRGACDTKGSAATMITAALAAKRQGQTNFGLLFTVEEETTFKGAIAAAQFFTEPLPYFIVGEPSSLQPVTCHFGIETITITAAGQAAHTSTPEKGINAIDELINEAYLKLKTLPLNKGTLGSVVQISGGVAPNIVPATAKLLFSMRIAPGDNTDYVGEIQKLVAPCKVDRGEFLPPVNSNLPPQLQFLGEGQTVRYCTELAFFQNGCILGPGDISYAHAKNEQISKQELAQAVDLYQKIIAAFQNTSGSNN